ncbi:MAG: glycosyltransferase family 4 protein [Acidimicrobiales bacterium]
MPHSATNPSRVGIVGRLVGSTDSWSGIPEGLAEGLRRLGLDPFFLSAEPSERTNDLARRWMDLTGRMDASWAQTPEMMLLRSSLARMRRSRQPVTSHWVQMGSEFGHPVGNFVTFEDMTVAQASEMPDYPPLRTSVKQSWIRRQKEIYRRAKACLVASRWAGAGLAVYGVNAEKVHVVGFGCNLQVAVDQRDWSTPRFLFVGLGWTRKNGDEVVGAFSDLRRDHPQARLDLVGDHPRIDQPGVVCHGELRRDVTTERTKLESLLRESTCLVVPSTYEPFGIVYAEAGWAGMPSIGTTIGGASDAIGSGGIVVDPHQPDQLIRAMRAMSEPDRAYVLGLEAQQHARLLTWDIVARRVAGSLGMLGGDPEPDLPLSEPMKASLL